MVLAFQPLLTEAWDFGETSRISKEFGELKASGEEAATAAKPWRGDYFLNADATEQRFNEVAGGYRIA